MSDVYKYLIMIELLNSTDKENYWSLEIENGEYILERTNYETEEIDKIAAEYAADILSI